MDKHILKRILVCGGRDFGNLNGIDRSHPEWEKKYKEYCFVFSKLDDFTTPNPTDDPETWLPEKGTVIIQGGATGADSAAHDWAVTRWVPYEEYKADWKQYGKRAGYIRNVEMLEKGKPDVVIAFPGGAGTAMMVNLAVKAGVPVHKIEYTDG